MNCDIHEAGARGEEDGRPQFVEREFREFLTCGVLAPHATWRRQIVGFVRPAPPNEGLSGPSGETPRSRTSGSWAWAALRRRAFGLDVLACPRCGGRLRFIATLEGPAVVAKVLAHLNRPRSAATPGPAPPPAAIGPSGR